MFKVNGLAAIVAVTLAASVTGIATAATVSQPQIYGCLSKDGSLSKVSNKAHTCPKGTSALSWNSKGVPGEKGAGGAAGAAGPAGPAGPSDLYFAHGSTSDITLMSNIATVTVPAGDYWIESKANFRTNSITGKLQTGPRCEIYNGTTSSVLEFAETQDQFQMDFQHPLAVSQDTQVTLRCVIASVSLTPDVVSTTGYISLTRVGAIHNQ
jgi:hypothetical protein